MLTCEFLAPREAESLKSTSAPCKTVSALTPSMCLRSAARFPPKVQFTPSRATRTLLTESAQVLAKTVEQQRCMKV